MSQIFVHSQFPNLPYFLCLTFVPSVLTSPYKVWPRPGRSLNCIQSDLYNLVVRSSFKATFVRPTNCMQWLSSLLPS